MSILRNRVHLIIHIIIRLSLVVKGTRYAARFPITIRKPFALPEDCIRGARQQILYASISAYGSFLRLIFSFICLEGKKVKLLCADRRPLRVFP